MISNVLLGIVFVLAVVCAVVLYVLDRIRRWEALFRWASVNGYRVLKFSQPMVEATPFPITPTKSQHVFKVVVADSEGRERQGFVRLEVFGVACRRLRRKCVGSRRGSRYCGGAMSCCGRSTQPTGLARGN
jgi:hypothetical protein